mgnify:CR=1 FL=1
MENPFKNMFGGAPKKSETSGVPKMTEGQQAAALDHIEDLKHGGDIKLTPEEMKAHEETGRLRDLQNEA